MTDFTTEQIIPAPTDRCRFAARMVKARIRLTWFRSLHPLKQMLLGGFLTELVLATVADDAEYEFLRNEQEYI